ncbi:uncharacterized protein LOC127837761 isoform X3 [Dreissena polymorpha]|uniref:uncharacterized protein LOC127837761 isoform X3 n=1 Tax=Dreissena polymorpha TaxID=45954 RepID=UPI002263B550|nr:uncharacterized protein LOC127837761 isoform X3 [Dreissena polymorpha]
MASIQLTSSTDQDVHATNHNEDTALNESNASETLIDRNTPRGQNPIVQESQNERQTDHTRLSWLKCSGKKKLVIGIISLLFVVIVGLAIWLAFCKQSNKEEYELQAALKLEAEQFKKVDEQIDPDGICFPTRCDELVLDIPGTSQWLEEFYCRSPNATKVSGCKIMLVSSYPECSDAGNLVCRNGTSVPVCNCTTGRKGTQCEQPHTEKVQCKCIAGNEKFVGENAMDNCSNMYRPEYWTKCFHNFNNGTKCTCFRFSPDALRITPNGKTNTAAAATASLWLMTSVLGIQQVYCRVNQKNYMLRLFDIGEQTDNP